MIDTEEKQRMIFLAQANLTLITHIGANVMRWSAVRLTHFIGLLFHLIAIPFCYFYVPGPGLLIGVILGLALIQFLHFRFAQASITSNLNVLKRIQMDYDQFNFVAKTNRSKANPPMALH